MEKQINSSDRKLIIALVISVCVLLIVGGYRFIRRTHDCYIETYNTGFHGHLYGKEMDRGAVIIFILDKGRFCLDNGYDNIHKSELYNFLEFGDTVKQEPLSKVIEIRRKGEVYYFRNNRLR